MSFSATPPPDPSRIVIGALGFGSFLEENLCNKILASAYEIGIRTIDLAASYGEGKARQLVASYLRRNPHQTWNLWDKMGMRMSFAGEVPTYSRDFPASPLDVVREIRGVLQQLGVEKLESFQLHLPLRFKAESHVVDGLVQAHDLGLISSVGCSNHEEFELASLSEQLNSRGQSVSHAQVQMSLIEQLACTSFIPKARSLSIKVVANRTFARGLLARRNPKDSIRLKGSLRMQEYSREHRDRIQAIHDVLAEHSGFPLAQIALSWALGPGGADRVVVGVSDENQLASAFEATSLGLTQQFWKTLFSDERVVNMNFSSYPPSLFDTR